MQAVGGGPGRRGAPWSTGAWLGVDRQTDGWTGPAVDVSGRGAGVQQKTLQGVVFGAWGWRRAKSPLRQVEQSCARVCEGGREPVCACPRECVCAHEHCSTGSRLLLKDTL